MKFTEEELLTLWDIIEKNGCFDINAPTNDKEMDLINKITKNLEGGENMS